MWGRESAGSSVQNFPAPIRCIPSPSTNIRAPSARPSKICAPPAKPASNVTGRKNSSGNLDRTFNYFQDDASNSPYSIRLSIKIGGADPAHGPVGGIHWHMVVNNQVEYIATDAARQKIPWVRITDSQGVVTVFNDAEISPTTFPNWKSARWTAWTATTVRRIATCRRTRPSTWPWKLGQIDRTIPWIKTNAVYVLTRKYNTDDQARDGIATAAGGALSR